MDMVKDIPVGKKAPEVVNVVIEVPLGSPNKIEYDEELKTFALDRVLSTRMTYPGNYGFIPQTEGGDDDPLDIVILGNHPLPVGIVASVRPIGVLVTEDEKGEDMKLLGVLEKDQRYDEIKDIENVAEHIKKEIGHFFEQYKVLEKDKWVKVKGWKNKDEALKIIRDAIEKFKEKSN